MSIKVIYLTIEFVKYIQIGWTIFTFVGPICVIINEEILFFVCQIIVKCDIMILGSKGHVFDTNVMLY